MEQLVKPRRERTQKLLTAGYFVCVIHDLRLILPYQGHALIQKRVCSLEDAALVSTQSRGSLDRTNEGDDEPEGSPRMSLCVGYQPILRQIRQVHVYFCIIQYHCNQFIQSITLSRFLAANGSRITTGKQDECKKFVSEVWLCGISISATFRFLFQSRHAGRRTFAALRTRTYNQVSSMLSYIRLMRAFGL